MTVTCALREAFDAGKAAQPAPSDDTLRALARETAEADEAITGTMLAHMPVPEAAAVVKLKCKAQNLLAALQRAREGR